MHLNPLDNPDLLSPPIPGLWFFSQCEHKIRPYKLERKFWSGDRCDRPDQHRELDTQEAD